MFKCLCGRYSNFGTTCSYCAKNIDFTQEEVEDVDPFYLVDKKDRNELAKRLKNSRGPNYL